MVALYVTRLLAGCYALSFFSKMVDFQNLLLAKKSEEKSLKSGKEYFVCTVFLDIISKNWPFLQKKGVKALNNYGTHFKFLALSQKMLCIYLRFIFSKK